MSGVWDNVVAAPFRHPWAAPLPAMRRIILWQLFTKRDNRRHLKPWLNDSCLAMRKGQVALTNNYYFGFMEFSDMAFVAHLLRPGDAFADVGANAGSYTVLAAKVAGARVHAFEPAPDTLLDLAANIEANDIAGLVTVHPVALGAEAGELPFTVGLDAVNHFIAGGIPVPVRTADGELCGKHVVAMKVDVEGAEDLVFAGASGLLAESQLVAVEVETLASGVREALEAAGFVERWYDPHARALRHEPLSWRAFNSLFVRNEAFVGERLRTAPPLRYAKRAV